MNEKPLIHIIVNEGARTGEAAKAWHIAKDMLQKKEANYKAYRTEYEGHATEIARRLCEQEKGVLYMVALGGDGTIHEVLNGITDFDRVWLGVIPGGSGNDFVRGHRLDTEPDEAVERILRCVRRLEEGMPMLKLDLGEVSSEGKSLGLYGISSGIGLDALVCKKAMKSRLKNVLNKLHLGKLTYVLYTLQSFFTMRTTEAGMEFDVGTSDAYTAERTKMIFAVAMNLRAEGGGVPMAPKAQPGDRCLTLCSAHGVPKWRTFFLLPFLMIGKQSWFKCFDIRSFKNVHITLKQPMALHADGEYLGDVSDVTFTSLPEKLQLLS